MSPVKTFLKNIWNWLLGPRLEMTDRITAFVDMDMFQEYSNNKMFVTTECSMIILLKICMTGRLTRDKQTND